MKSSKSDLDIKNNIQIAKVELDEHLAYLNKMSNSGIIIFSTHWENDYYYVTYSNSCLENNDMQCKILSKKLIYESCKADSNLECSICLDPLDKKVVKLDNCNHMFHKKCIKKLVNSDKYAKCPLCRSGNNSDEIDIINFNNERCRRHFAYSSNNE